MEQQTADEKSTGKSTKVALVFYDILTLIDLIACIFAMYFAVLIKSAGKATGSSSSSIVSSAASSLASSLSSASAGTQIGQGLGMALVLSLAIALFVIIGGISLIMTIGSLIWGTKQFVRSQDKKVSLKGKICLGVNIASGVLLIVALLLAIF
ncbi:MAG: hypothetical protein LKJ88_06605 [Bacilli bacterium]|jgi:hypothetical protein|nr:hypothetical protein [Bacilli bacterium]